MDSRPLEAISMAAARVLAEYLENGYTVQVDPGAVFATARLCSYLADKCDSPRGVYVEAATRVLTST